MDLSYTCGAGGAPPWDQSPILPWRSFAPERRARSHVVSTFVSTFVSIHRRRPKDNNSARRHLERVLILDVKGCCEVRQ